MELVSYAIVYRALKPK